MSIMLDIWKYNKSTIEGYVGDPSVNGSGCTLGDIMAEWPVFLVPTIAIWFGWH